MLKFPFIYLAVFISSRVEYNPSQKAEGSPRPSRSSNVTCGSHFSCFLQTWKNTRWTFTAPVDKRGNPLLNEATILTQKGTFSLCYTIYLRGRRRGEFVAGDAVSKRVTSETRNMTWIGVKSHNILLRTLVSQCISEEKRFIACASRYSIFN